MESKYINCINQTLILLNKKGPFTISIATKLYQKDEKKIQCVLSENEDNIFDNQVILIKHYV